MIKKLILFFSILDLYYIWYLKEIFLTLNTGFKNLGVSEISLNLIIFILIITFIISPFLLYKNLKKGVMLYFIQLPFRIFVFFPTIGVFFLLSPALIKIGGETRFIIILGVEITRLFLSLKFIRQQN